MRLATIPPGALAAEQRPLFERPHASIAAHPQRFATAKPDGVLVGLLQRHCQVGRPDRPVAACRA